MKTEYFLIQHQRGNHSPEQVFNHGIVQYAGKSKERNEVYKQMVRWCKNKWNDTSTNEKQRDFVKYQMSDIFLVKVKNGKISWG